MRRYRALRDEKSDVEKQLSSARARREAALRKHADSARALEGTYRQLMSLYRSANRRMREGHRMPPALETLPAITMPDVFNKNVIDLDRAADVNGESLTTRVET